MRNLNSYIGDDFQFHRDIIDAKRNTASDLDYKVRVSGYSSNIETKFEEYRVSFDDNSLSTLVAHPFSIANKVDILKLYSYKSKLIQRLKINITTTQAKRIISTCQNCSISEINSFDHIIPKEEFCEFVVNPKNLFPSCTQCNSYKSSLWKDNENNPLFLNLYLDILPPEQYLFADIDIEDGVIIANFRLENINNINEDLYNLIH